MGLNKPVITTSSSVDISNLATKSDLSGLAKTSDLSGIGGGVKSVQSGTMNGPVAYKRSSYSTASFRPDSNKEGVEYVDITISDVDINKCTCKVASIGYTNDVPLKLINKTTLRVYLASSTSTGGTGSNATGFLWEVIEFK